MRRVDGPQLVQILKLFGTLPQGVLRSRHTAPLIQLPLYGHVVLTQSRDVLAGIRLPPVKNVLI